MNQTYLIHPITNYIFLAISTAFFGFTVLGGTLVSIVAGSLIVLLVYLLGKEMLNPKSGVIMASILMFQPLYYFYSASRALNNIPSTLFFVASIYLFTKFIKTKDYKWVYLTAIFTSLAILTRFASAIILVIILAYLVLDKETRKALFTKKLLVPIGILVLAASMFLAYNYWATGQFFDTSVYMSVSFSKTTLDAAPWTYYLTSFIPYMRWILVALFALGLTFMFLPKGEKYTINKTHLFFLLTIALTLIEISIVSVKTDRYLLPIVPFIVAFAGYGIYMLGSLTNKYHRAIPYLIMIPIVAFTMYTFYTEGTNMIKYSATGFCGFDQAGQWVQSSTLPTDNIYAGSYGQIAFYADRDNLKPIPNTPAELDALIAAGSVDYIILDKWERTQPQYIFGYVYNNSRIQAIGALADPANQSLPLVILYKVNNTVIS
jgi:4-amino-4-deoxy-L-arabinose transferase-like glycosyltransferase